MIAEAKRQQIVEDTATWNQKTGDDSATLQENQEKVKGTAEVNPVQTRKHKAAEKSRQTQDDKESEDSGAGATDLFLHNMDLC